MTESERTGVIAGLSNSVIKALPGQMLLMLLLNLCFIAALFWLLSQQNTSREKALLMLLESCSKTVPMEALPHLLKPQSQ